MGINSRLLACQAEIGEALYYAKLVLRVDPYFQVLALLKLTAITGLPLPAVFNSFHLTTANYKSSKGCKQLIEANIIILD
jgi:hypothetical protein